mmetsp:Transcript_50031/g.140263  ORF Transcript_50031/g.140263 Transcript_50031/m.140263 type:complete len:211 (+) Transcript_50031:140-772(+)
MGLRRGRILHRSAHAAASPHCANNSLPASSAGAFLLLQVQLASSFGDSGPGLALAFLALLLVRLHAVFLLAALTMPRLRPTSVQGCRDAAIDPQEVPVREETTCLVVFLARYLRHVFPLDFPGGNLLPDAGDELVHRVRHLVEEHLQVAGILHLNHFLEHGECLAHTSRPTFHVLDLQRALLQSLAALLVFLQYLIQPALMLLRLQVEGP